MNLQEILDEQKFEHFLLNEHAEQSTGLDEEMSDDFNAWLEELELDDIIKFADEFLRQSNLSILKAVIEMIEDWYTVAPKYRTKKNLLAELNKVIKDNEK